MTLNTSIRPGAGQQERTRAADVQDMAFTEYSRCTQQPWQPRARQFHSPQREAGAALLELVVQRVSLRAAGPGLLAPTCTLCPGEAPPLDHRPVSYHM